MAKDRANSNRRRDTAMLPGQPFHELRDALLAQDPEMRKAWDAMRTRRRLVAGLLRLRHKANLTQRELAERAGWPPKFVAQLESLPRRGEALALPDVDSLMRYAEACDSNFGLVFAEPRARGNRLHVSAAVGFGANAHFLSVMEHFTGTEIGIKRRPGKDEPGGG